MINDLRKSASHLRVALSIMAQNGRKPIEIFDELDPRCEIAQHYFENFATTPATSRSGDEPIVIYRRPKGFQTPVLMGLFGSRSGCERLLGCNGMTAANFIASRLDKRVPVRVQQPDNRCRLKNKLDDIPIMTTTYLDAGPYITSGLVLARDPENRAVNVSIHRMRKLGHDRLTIWMLPGRGLDTLYRKATEMGQSLPVTINIGVDPVVYITSTITSPFLRTGESELELAGAVAGRPIDVAQSDTQDTWFLTESEFVIEGEITHEFCDEYEGAHGRYSMPEFLGYMGGAKPQLPVIKISQVSCKNEPYYQTFLGPGKEQSTLLGIPAEAGMIASLRRDFSDDFSFRDIRYLDAAGGQLLMMLNVKKMSNDPKIEDRLLAYATEKHTLLKGIILLDEDTDLYSDGDFFWSLATRFQPSRDLSYQTGMKGFPLDPSQAAGYLPGTTEPTTDKFIIDLTVPNTNKLAFRRLTRLID